MFIRHNQRGVSLIELIMFIVIVSVALAGILLVMNVTTKSSADPLVHKQALAIAESLLEEVELMPFTICDPDDPNAATGVGCTVLESTMGPEAGETRYSTAAPFDNVNDYDGCQLNTGVANACDSTGSGGIRDVTNTVISTALNGYSATVTVAGQSVGGIAAAESLLITVSVTGPDGLPVVVEGVRTRYAPRAVP